MILQQSGSAQTIHAMLYVDKLTRHWAHSFDVRQHADGAWQIDFGNKTGISLASRGEVIEVKIVGGESDLPKLRQVTEENVGRLAHLEDQLRYEWGKPVFVDTSA